MYIQRESRERLFVTSRVGWHHESFVLPENTFAAPAAEAVVYQAGFGASHNYKVQGTLTEWQEHIGRRCVGNSRLVFSVSLAFVGPLLGLVDQDSGGFHLRGLSSSGKSTALLAAGSVWGGGRKGFIQSWRATSNGLEGVAELHNDGFLCLDELSQIAPEEAGRTAYMLANGQGKVRMTKEIRVRPAMEWRLSFLSSGEISLADHLQTIRRQVHGGQEVRLIDLAADAGKGMGVFENLNGASSPDVFANELSSAALAYYGKPDHGIPGQVGNRTGGCAGGRKGRHSKVPGYSRPIWCLRGSLPRCASVCPGRVRRGVCEQHGRHRLGGRGSDARFGDLLQLLVGAARQFRCR